jgi:ParB family chromosome partitioning protein
VENIQREDLNAIEEARAFERLISEFHLTQEQVAERTGKERATVANSVRLLSLDRPIVELIEDGRLSGGHGRALLGFAETKTRIALAKRAARGRLTVRQLERLSARRARAATAAPPQHDPNEHMALRMLEQALGTKVTLRMATKKRPGVLAIEFYNHAQLMGLYDTLMK